MSNDTAAELFVRRWEPSRGAERAVKDQFFLELCDLLGVDRPDPGVDAASAYRFEKPVDMTHPDGSTTKRFIDFYRSGCFIIEAKQGSEAGDQARGTARRGTHGWSVAMQAAFGQAIQYAAALALSPEGMPPFLITCDIGHVFHVWEGFSGSYGGYYGRKKIIALGDLLQEETRLYLATIFTDPWSLDPSLRATEITRDVAAKLARLAVSLEAGGHDPELVAQFLMRCIFTMFAEDVGLLPKDIFTNAIAQRWIEQPHLFAPQVAHLWTAMDEGLPFDWEILRRFNGGLFRMRSALPLTKAQLEDLLEAARCDWSAVEPTIFGTLLERALAPEERDRLGAHFTPREYIERLVRPTVIEPIRAEWDLAQAEVRDLLARSEGDNPGDETLLRAIETLRTFHRHLCELRILDPACGTGNFLYVTLDLLKQVESEVLAQIEDLALLLSKTKRERLAGTLLGGGGAQTLVALGDQVVVDPHQFLGLELNPRAREIAELVLWIGHLQWHHRVFGRHVPEPILQDHDNIVHADAVLDYERTELRRDANAAPVTVWDMRTYKRHPVTGKKIPDEDAREPVMDPVDARAAEWPGADFVVSNPPFIGNKQMRRDLGDGYAEALRSAYPDISNTADLVMYWWDKAATLCRDGRLRAFGLITTNSITQTFNRKVLERHLSAKRSPLAVAWAIPDHPWADAGADVRIAMTVGVRAAGLIGRPRLGAVVSEARGQRKVWRARQVNVTFREVERIHADLTGGADVAGAVPLRANEGLSFQGMNLVGKGFRLSREEVRDLGYDPEALPDVIGPYMNARDLTQAPKDRFVIDLFGLSADEARQQHPRLYQHLLERLKPERDQNKDPKARRIWWQFGRPREAMRPALAGLARYIITPETAKHRFFVWAPRELIPDHKLYAICSDDASVLGVLSSRHAVTFILAAGGRMGVGNDPIFNNTRCFVPFPFPEATAERRARIADLAEQLDEHRKQVRAAWAKATFTAQYNALERIRETERAAGSLTEQERKFHDKALVGVLRSLHDDLDRAVADAYGWPVDLTDEEILERLVALNAERAAEEQGGTVRWLRPELQAPGQPALPEPAPATIVAETSPERPGPTPAESGAARPPWPRTIREQLHAVRATVASQARGWTPEEVARSYTNGQARTVARHLETLEGLGVVLAYEGAEATGTLWRTVRAEV